jgi:uncharacterized protein (TIGR03435 family)
MSIRKLLFAAACSIAAATSLQGQQPPAFEVASIRPGDSQPQFARLDFLPTGRMVATNWPLGLLIREVYSVLPFQIVGLDRLTANWKTDRFNIQAQSGGVTDRDELKRMAQTLLVDRFRLKFHHEQREMPVYALVPAKSGVTLKMTENTGTARGIGGISSTVPMGHLFGSNVSMAHFIQILSEQQLDRPVIDRTNFAEPFDFTLDYAPTDQPGAAGPSLFVAVQEQLGLRLDAVRAPIDVMVIDHVEQPSEN